MTCRNCGRGEVSLIGGYCDACRMYDSRNGTARPIRLVVDKSLRAWLMALSDKAGAPVDEVVVALLQNEMGVRDE